MFEMLSNIVCKLLESHTYPSLSAVFFKDQADFMLHKKKVREISNIDYTAARMIHHPSVVRHFLN